MLKNNVVNCKYFTTISFLPSKSRAIIYTSNTMALCIINFFSVRQCVIFGGPDHRHNSHFDKGSRSPHLLFPSKKQYVLSPLSPTSRPCPLALSLPARPHRLGFPRLLSLPSIQYFLCTSLTPSQYFYPTLFYTPIHDTHVLFLTFIQKSPLPPPTHTDLRRSDNNKMIFKNI